MKQRFSEPAPLIRRVCVFVGMSLASALSLVPKCSAVDTAGVMLEPKDLSASQLVAAEWSATVSEYQSNLLLRIEFNGVRFFGAKGAASVGVMLMNLCHDYENDAVQMKRRFPGLSLYFSSLNKELVTGVELLASPTTAPHFKRIFENVDGMGFGGMNVYNTEPLREPRAALPVKLKWYVSRGALLQNPPGQLRRALNGAWVPLTGAFREWLFAVDIDGKHMRVARYLLPESHAAWLDERIPITLHQEYFGAARGKLHEAPTEVRYHDFKVTDINGRVVSITNWHVVWVIDDDWARKDKRFGWAVDGKNLMSRCGHPDDIQRLKRDKGEVLSMNPN